MWLQFEQFAIPKAQAAAIHDRVDEDAVLAGLVRLWGWAQRERKTQVTATELRGFFRVDCIGGLLAFDFLEPLKEHDLFRVRGTSRYVLDHEARSRGGKATAAKNLMRGRQKPGSAPAPAGNQPEASRGAAPLPPGSLPAGVRGEGRREKKQRKEGRKEGKAASPPALGASSLPAATSASPAALDWLRGADERRRRARGFRTGVDGLRIRTYVPDDAQLSPKQLALLEAHLETTGPEQLAEAHDYWLGRPLRAHKDGSKTRAFLTEACVGEMIRNLPERRQDDADGIEAAGLNGHGGH